LCFHNPDIELMIQLKSGQRKSGTLAPTIT